MQRHLRPNQWHETMLNLYTFLLFFPQTFFLNALAEKKIDPKLAEGKEVFVLAVDENVVFSYNAIKHLYDLVRRKNKKDKNISFGGASGRILPIGSGNHTMKVYKGDLVGEQLNT